MELSKFIGQKIRALRENKNMTQEDLAKILNTTRQSVSRYEQGKRKAGQDELFELADFFGISINYFFPTSVQKTDIQNIYDQLNETRQNKVYHYAEDQLEEQNKVVYFNDHVKEESSNYPNGIPLPGGVAAGKALAYGDTSYDQVTENVPEGADVALTVHGNSMEPLIKNNSIIFFKSQPVVENGEIAIVEINNNEVTCKKFYKEDGKIILRSINEDYDDMVFEDTPIRILGKVLI